jgi:hypothetical protein
MGVATGADSKTTEQVPASAQRPFQFRLVNLLGIVAVVAALLAVIGPLLRYGHRMVTLDQCYMRQKQLSIALWNYHDRYGSFPPAYLVDGTGKPAHSWRVLVLPFLDYTSQYEEYRFAEPWNGPGNANLSWRTCPFSPVPAVEALVELQTMWPLLETELLGRAKGAQRSRTSQMARPTP